MPGKYNGPAVLSYGFRPFFLAGALYAGAGILIWLPLFLGRLALPTRFSPLDWHIHEMLYGYLPAVIAGFLLTAISNWTGRPPLRGAALAVLVTVWLAGRAAISFSAAIGPAAAGVIDCLFLLLVAAAAAREVAAAGSWRNLPPVVIVLVFGIGNVLFHIEAHSAGVSAYGTRLGIAASVALISLIGGRIVPAFTRNWLVRENPGRLPAPPGRFDIAVAGISALALIVWVLVPGWPGTAALSFVAGLAQAVRLMRWAGDRAWRDRLVLVLHVGYAFVPLGFVLLAGAILFPRQLPLSGAIHAWTAGAIGIMTLAVMTRVSLGHTGRRLSADGITQTLYAFALVAALARIAAAFTTPFSTALLLAAAALWIAGFWLFALHYGPWLCRPRADQRG
jgi:uncharacterized protein involved in response to NO